MHAALDALRAIGHSTAESRRTWAVLGEMLELGDLSRTAHEQVGRWAAELGADRLVVVGAGAAAIADSGHGRGDHYRGDPGRERRRGHDLLSSQLRSGDVVLLKSSRDAGLRWLGDRLVGIEVPA